MDTQVRSTVINQDDEDTLIDGSGTGSRSRAIMGTYAYMSPEQRKGQPADARSDLYAVGLMTFRMLTGEETPGMERASELGLGLDKGWDAWLIKALKGRPDDRFPTAGEMRKSLDFQAAVLSVAVKPEPAPAPEAPKVKREPEPLPRPAPARPATKPRRKHPTAAPVAPAKGARTWLYLCVVALVVVFVVGLFAWDVDIGEPLDPSEVSAHAERMKENLPAKKPFAVPSIGLEMLWVKSGTFEMDEYTPHTVTLSDGFWLGKHEVTQAQWQKVMGSNPSRFKGGDRPVERVSWTDVTSFCDKLTELERKAGRLPPGMSYQLPTEAQWEYACRAGTKTTYAFGDSLTSGQANISGGPGETTDVGNYPANGRGFHDMHGNVWEWCADWYGDYPTGAARDPVGPAVGSYRVLRGGSWYDSALFARSAYRIRFVSAFSGSYLGFRLSLRPASK
jgi:formylglycine-generating enzyme required for sulfatase activity